jgi:hypothetical protein
VDQGLVGATASSGLSVTLSIDPSSTSGCTISGSTVSYGGGVGTCIIDADQAGNADYLAAPQAQQSFTIAAPTPPPGYVGVSINSGDYATDSYSVQLDLVWPAGATSALVSNDGGFDAKGGTEMIALSPEVPWTLENTGFNGLPETVYVRFLGAGINTTTFADDIIVDETVPSISSATLVGSSGSATSSAIAAELRGSAASSLHSYSVRVLASEQVSGISTVALSSSTSGGVTVTFTSPKNKGILTLDRTVSVSMATAPRYVRVRSAGGRWSRWLAVAKATSTTVLKLSNAKLTYGDEGAEHLSVTVSPEFAGSTPTGTVTVKDSTTTLCVISLSGAKGACTLSATKLPAGTYSLVTTYSGSANFGSSASVKESLTVAKATSTTVLKLSNAKLAYGDEGAEHLSVTVSPEFAGSTPYGSVTLKESKTTLCVITLKSAKGTCTLSAGKLPVGTYHVVATYGGSTDFDTSSSAKQTLTVAKATSKTALALSNAKLAYGDEQTEHLSVTVSPQYSGSTPYGSVTLKESKTTLCVITLKSAKGTCTLSAGKLPVGTYHVVATYGGSTDFKGSASVKESLTVAKATSKIALKLSNARVTYGDEGVEHLSVTVSPQYSGTTPTGKVTITESTTVLCVITLSGAKGSCRLSAKKLKVGTYDLVATYGGSSNFKGSTSAKETFTVAK